MSLSTSLALLGILGALLAGAVSPGPSFVLVSRIAVMNSRKDALAAALGMGAGGATFATLALLGLITMLLQVEWLYLTLRVVGGVYLVYLGVRIWRGAAEPLHVQDDGVASPSSTLRSFALGFVTQTSNPKTAIVYASIFAALLPADAPMWLNLSLPPLVFALETSWYIIIAVAFSAHRPRSAYLRSKAWVDHIAGAVLGIIGVRVISDSVMSSN